MLYQRNQFSCPARNVKTSDYRWDLAFLDKEEFKKKYNISEQEYKKLIK